LKGEVRINQSENGFQQWLGIGGWGTISSKDGVAWNCKAPGTGELVSWRRTRSHRLEERKDGVRHDEMKTIGGDRMIGPFEVVVSPFRPISLSLLRGAGTAPPRWGSETLVQ